MFSDNPSKFFPYTQVDIVVYPNGKLQDPSNFIEVPSIKGTVDFMINEVMTYLRTNIIKERVLKPGDKAESIRFSSIIRIRHWKKLLSTVFTTGITRCASLWRSLLSRTAFE